jgi:putative transposase
LILRWGVGRLRDMARQASVAPGGLVYHVLNRAVARLPQFCKPADFEAFERVLAAGLARADGPRLHAH